MPDKDKIRLMTALAIYEKDGGAEELKIAEHYRYDFVMTQLFSAFIRYTVCFSVCISLYLVFNSNSFFYSINSDGFIKTVRNYGIIYLAGLVIYLIIALIVYNERHKNAVENSMLYAQGLKKLNKRYYLARRKKQ